MKEVDNLLKNFRDLVRYFKKSSIAKETLLKILDLKKKQPVVLINDVITRWNSSLEMIRRVLRVDEEISETLIQLKKKEFLVSEKQIHQASQLIDILELFEEITLRICGKQNQLSVVIPFSNSLVENLKDILDTKNHFVTYLPMIIKDLEDTTRSWSYKYPEAISTILDPRFKGRQLKVKFYIIYKYKFITTYPFLI